MIICINNNKGGSLKTTVTTNLAGVLASQGKKVLIIDTDNQSNVAMTFGHNPDDYNYGLFDVLVDGLPAEHAIINVHENIDILPATDDLVAFDFEVIGNNEQYPFPFHIMKDKCSHLKSQYDYILIDTPPSLSLMVGNVFTFADKVLIPFTPETYSMRSLVKVVSALNEFKATHNPNIELLGVVATMVKAQTTLHTGVMQETRKFAHENDLKMFESFIPNTVRYASAVAFDRLPATLLEKRNDKAEVYFDLWKEIESHVQQPK